MKDYQVTIDLAKKHLNMEEVDPDVWASDVEKLIRIIESVPAETLVIKGVSQPCVVADTLELEKAHNQCHNCFSSWNYRGKQDQGWCYTHRNYMPECKDYRDS